MGISVKIECDQCKQLRQETNHWYMAEVFENMRINIFPLDVSNVRQKVLCGEACVHSFIAQNLASLHTVKP